VNLAGVDVVVPCYNYGRYLRQCTQSVLRETRFPIRILIIDDASPDGSAEQAREIAAEDSRVEVIAHRANKGHIATYNEGIAWAQAPYMLLLSADDMVAPGALARAITLMEANPNVAFVYGRSILFSDEDDIWEMHGSLGGSEAAVHRGAEFIREFCSRPDNPVETATAVVRTAIQKKVGGYRPQLPHAGDLEMWLRCAAQGDVGIIPAVQAFTRIHAGNMRHGYKAELTFADYEQRRRALDMFFEGQWDLLDDAEDLERLARRSLAEQVLWAAARGFEEENDPAATRLIDLAQAIDGSITRTPLWWKTAAKRAVGWTVWRAVAPVLAAVRGSVDAVRLGQASDRRP
jgi:GT2 family glycosyltransferase